MKSFGRIAFTAVLVLGLATPLMSCSRHRGGGSGPAITTPDQGRQAASGSLQAVSMAEGSAAVFLNLGSVGLTAVGASAPRLTASGSFSAGSAAERIVRMSEGFAQTRSLGAVAAAVKKAKAQSSEAPPAVTGTVACTGGGNATWALTANSEPNSYTAELTFADCREDDSELDGIYHMTAVVDPTGETNLAVTLGSSGAFTIAGYSPGYGALVTEYALTDFTLVVRSVTTAAGVSLNTIAAGTMQLHDYLNREDYELVISEGFSQETVMSLPAGESFSLTTNGALTEAWTEPSGSGRTVTVSFNGLRLDLVSTAGYEDLGISGEVSFAWTPASCLNGAFTVASPQPIRYDTALGRTVSGTVTIDDVTAVSFNPDETLTVSTGDDSAMYGSSYDLGKECPLSTFDEPAPVSGGLAGTAAAANGMTVTLTWNGPNGVSRSDMDLHLNYYAVTAPTATTTGTWFIDYHAGGSCVNPTDLELGSDTVDVDNDGVCDIGLDFDNTAGYGPEHITAVKLPEGYYVLSVNNFSSSDVEVPVTVTIQIGDSLFGPYTHTFASADTTYDGDGISAAAWFAVADLVVDNTGLVIVQAHDPLLELWHDGAVGLFTPKRGK
jgi:hypothetical protein